MYTNICKDIDAINTIRGLIGKQFNCYECDKFVFSNCVYGIVGLHIGDKSYKITSLLEPVRRFTTDTDVAIFKFEEVNPAEIKTMIDSGEEMIKTPIESTIESIMVVNDKQSISKGNETFSFESTAGIIIKLVDGREVSFEIRTWFSEMITIRRGYNLIKNFVSTSEFTEEWEGTGYESSINREITVIS